MGKPSPPKAPDYTPLAMAQANTAESSLEAARMQAQIAREQMQQQNFFAERSAQLGERYATMAQQQAEFGSQQYADIKPYLQSYMQSQLDFTGAAMQNEREQAANATQTYNRYMTTFAPKEDQFAQEAFQYASPARMEQAAAEARGDVATSFGAQKDAATRQLMSYGVDPSQGAYGRTQAMDIAKAASQAAAGTMARRQTELQGKQLELGALEVGQKLPAQAIGQAASGLQGAQIGGGGISAGGNLLNAGTNAMGSPTAWAGMSNPYTALAGTYGQQATGMFGNQIQAIGGASQAYGRAGDMMNNMFSNQMEGYKAQAAASPWAGIGQLAGQLGSAAILASDIRVKDDIAPYERGLDEVLDLNPVTFVYNGIFTTEDDGRKHIGLIAG
jgi:hypothetical protein